MQTNSSTSPISTLADHPSPNCSAQDSPTSPSSLQFAGPIQTNLSTLATSPISKFLVYLAPVRKAKVIRAANKCARILTSVESLHFLEKQQKKKEEEERRGKRERKKRRPKKKKNRQK